MDHDDLDIFFWRLIMLIVVAWFLGAVWAWL